MRLTDQLRGLRDVAYRFVWQRMLGRQTANQLGIVLALDHPAISDRMFYVISKDYESRDALLAAQVLNQRSRVLELGASSGFMALYCRKVIGVEAYAMVEANPALGSLIERNFELNGLERSDTPFIEAAAAAEDGAAEFVVHRNIWSSSVIDRGGETIQVPALTLPTIIKQLPFAPDCLIADIEGGELFIPAEDFAHFSTIVLETHPKLLSDGADRTRALLDRLAALHFQILDRQGDSYVMVRAQ